MSKNDCIQGKNSLTGPFRSHVIHKNVIEFSVGHFGPW